MSGHLIVAGVAILALLFAGLALLVNAGGERIERCQRNARNGGDR